MILYGAAMPYEVILHSEPQEFLARLDLAEKVRIVKRLEKLADNPRSVGEPRGKFWILKIGRGGYRAAYFINDVEKRVEVAEIQKRTLGNMIAFTNDVFS